MNNCIAFLKKQSRAVVVVLSLLGNNVAMLADSLSLPVAQAMKLVPAVQAKIVAKGPLTYTEVGDQLVGSFGVISNNTEKLTSDELETMEEQDNKINLKIVDLNEQERLQKVYSVLACSDKQKLPLGDTTGLGNAKNQAIRSLVNDLELLYSRDEDNHADHLFSRLDNTQTSFGRAALAKMLTSPTSDVNVLHSRQALIKELLVNDALRNQLASLVSQVKNAEPALFSNWDKENSTTREYMQSLYFSKKLPAAINKSSLIMESKIRVGNVLSALSTTRMIWLFPALFWAQAKYNPAVKNALKTPMVQHYLELNGPTVSLFSAFKICGRMVVRSAGKYWPFMKAFVSRNQDVLWDQYDVSPQDMKAFSAVVAGGHATAGVYLGFEAYQAKQNISVATQQMEAIKYQQRKLIGMADLVNAVKQIEALAQANPILKHGLKDLFQIQDVTHRTSDFKKLVNMLQTGTFKGDASFFSLSGRVLAGRGLIKNTKNEFVGFMQALGEVDALLSVAQLVKDFATEPVHYSFVDYRLDSTKPYANFENFWNPMVVPSKAVPNSIELGGTQGPRNVVLTGSNTGGKSTALKAILTVALLAHTIGIAPADHVVVTPFAYIGSTLNIIDNTVAGKSLYQAEANRAAALVNAVQSLKGNNFGFLIVDELFRGTTPDKAENETYNCIKDFLACENSLAMIATHFVKRPTGLEQETNGLCKNYRIEARIDENGKVVRTFKLEPGINRYNVADDVLHAAKEKIKQESADADAVSRV